MVGIAAIMFRKADEIFNVMYAFLSFIVGTLSKTGVKLYVKANNFLVLNFLRKKVLSAIL